MVERAVCKFARTVLVYEGVCVCVCVRVFLMCVCIRACLRVLCVSVLSGQRPDV